ncbi:hypothetical protein Scep_008406 [Stephania cephalantha]|uniref:Uncharacterized protein n=1 Tax=Stephania cephalantha TaxID=152367 RepID=A0AAP0PP33_9MAGN
MVKRVKTVPSNHLTFFIITLFLFFTNVVSEAQSIIIDQPTPQLNTSFNLTTTTTSPSSSSLSSSCSYRVSIKTSCSSTSFTRDRISLAFGDFYHNEVYAARLDNPSSRTFERCSTDTFQISGSCMYQICYLYLLRTGSDGWKPEYVKIYTPNYGAVTYKFNSWVPNGVWFGFDSCTTTSASMLSSA